MDESRLLKLASLGDQDACRQLNRMRNRRLGKRTLLHSSYPIAIHNSGVYKTFQSHLRRRIRYLIFGARHGEIMLGADQGFPNGDGNTRAVSRTGDDFGTGSYGHDDGSGRGGGFPGCGVLMISKF